MRPQRHGIDFLGALVREPGLDQVGREHSTLEQEGVVGLEGRQRLVQGARRVLHMLALLGLEVVRSEEHTSELQSQSNLVCRLLLEKKKNNLHKALLPHDTRVQTIM